MAKDKKAKDLHAAQVPGQSATAVGQAIAITEAGPQGPSNDAPQPAKQEAAETIAAASGAATAEGPGPVKPEGQSWVAASQAPPPPFLTLAFPLPADIPPEALKAASIVVTSKAERGRRRAGFAFTRDETSIPFADLSEQQIEALTGDAELVVSLRVQKPN